MAAGLPLLPDEEGYWYPNWRVAWEEDLDETTRRRIRRAVRAGQALDDPYEAAFAVTLAVKERRVWRWWPIFTILSLGPAVFWLVALFAPTRRVPRGCSGSGNSVPAPT